MKLLVADGWRDEGPRSLALQHIAKLNTRGGTDVEILPDDRHNLGPAWLTARVFVLCGARVKREAAFVGHGVTSENFYRYRRFYIYPTGLFIEGGRGGARIYDGRYEPPDVVWRGPNGEPRLDTPLLGTARSIQVAAAMVEGMARVR